MRNRASTGEQSFLTGSHTSPSHQHNGATAVTNDRNPPTAMLVSANEGTVLRASLNYFIKISNCDYFD